MVPVLRDVDAAVVRRASRRASLELAERARNGKLALDDLQGGTFIDHQRRHLRLDDVDAAAQHPQTGILGMHNIVKRADGRSATQIEVRPMMYLALSYDHRVVDGREAV